MNALSSTPSPRPGRRKHGSRQAELFTATPLTVPSPPRAAPPRAAPQTDETKAEPLWLALHLPWLALELFADDEGRDHPFAVTETGTGERRILIANRAARTLGIKPGLKVNAAYALAPTLRLRPRDAAAEQAALARLAGWAGRYTPQVVLEGSSGLLLEISASLRLFGGLEAILRGLHQGVLALGYRPRIAAAPTPGGAMLLARAGGNRRVEGRHALRRALAELPIELLELPRRGLNGLHGLGLRRIGELLRLPRAGLARRHGVALVERLDRLLGGRADPREPFVPPERYGAALPLPAEEERTERLLHAARRLLLELAGFLEARGAGVQVLELTLRHRDRPASRIELGLATPGRDAERLASLLKERLERFELPAPVLEIALRGGRLYPLAAHSARLFERRAHPEGAWRGLVERLTARLGERTVRGLGAVADHRPERGWRHAAPGTATDTAPASAAAPPRPLWLLPRPQPLPIYDGRPHYHGPLTLRRGPERIEAGWWDGGDIARDYFAAESPAGMRLWIFREPARPGRWFLHGRFG